MTLPDPLSPPGYRVEYGTRPLGTLLPAAYNPRVMPSQEREKLIRSLATFGFVEPVVVRAEDGLLIGGHQRVDCWGDYLTRRGATAAQVAEAPLPVMVITGLSDERAKLLNLALNKVSGEWDHGKLADLLGSLGTLAAPELELSGFSVPEIGDYTALLGGLPAIGGATAGAGAGAAPPSTAGGGGGDSAGGTEPGAATAADALDGALSRLVVEFASPADAAVARAILGLFGMTGDADAPDALLTALRVAAATLPDQSGVPQAGPPASAKRRPRVARPDPIPA